MITSKKILLIFITISIAILAGLFFNYQPLASLYYNFTICNKTAIDITKIDGSKFTTGAILKGRCAEAKVHGFLNTYPNFSIHTHENNTKKIYRKTYIDTIGNSIIMKKNHTITIIDLYKYEK